MVICLQTKLKQLLIQPYHKMTLKSFLKSFESFSFYLQKQKKIFNLIYFIIFHNFMTEDRIL